MQFDCGYLSPFFINQPNAGFIKLNNPCILLTDKKISNIRQLLPILEIITKSN